MKVYPINLESDYETLQSWWNGYKWQAVPKEYLPKNGFMVKNDTNGIVAGFCYMTDSPIILFEWIIGNPKLSSGERKEGLSFLIKFVKLWAKANNASVLYSMTKNTGFIDTLETNGFLKSDENITHFIGRV